MAGLSCGEASELAWDMIEQEAKDFITIPESIVAPTVRMLANSELGDVVIEAGESAVAGLAALICAAKQDDLRDVLRLSDSSRVLLFGSEGVTDQTIFDEIMSGEVHG